MAHGPILEEATTQAEHCERRDVVAALEKALAEAMSAAGYEVINSVHSRKPLDAELFAGVRTAFAAHFSKLTSGAGTP